MINVELKDKGCKHGVLISFRNNLILTEVNVINKICELVMPRLQVVGNPDLYIRSFYRYTDADAASLLALQKT